MPIHDNPFYHKTISNTTVAVGAIFNNIKIQRTDSLNNTTVIAVPLKYEKKEAWYQKLVKDQKDSEVTFQQLWPRISYSLTTLARDASKGQSKYNKYKKEIEVVDGDDVRKWQYQPVPYKLMYTVNILTKYMDDACQIVEQILPYFNPTVNLKVTEISETEICNDVQVSLDGTPQWDDNYTEGFQEERFILVTLELSASTNLYQEIRETKTIRTVCIDIDNLGTNTDMETMLLEAEDGEFENKDNHTLTIEIGA